MIIVRDDQITAVVSAVEKDAHQRAILSGLSKSVEQAETLHPQHGGAECP
jgi:hypothetical protein